MSFAPPEWSSAIRESFEDEAHPAYAQVATATPAGAPRVRTVHVRYVTEYDTVGFSTNVFSPKWAELARNPRISGCWFDTKRRIQIRWEGSVRLVPWERASDAERRVLERLWLLIRPTVREEYWREFGQPDPSAELPCPTHGVVLCRPDLWDLYELVSDDYRTHRRTIHRLGGNVWRAERVTLTDGRPLP
jgi:hypothetical protein